MSHRVDSLFAGVGGEPQAYPQQLLRLRIVAIVSILCGLLGPLLWLSPLALIGSLWAWFGIRRITKHASRLNAPAFLDALVRSHKTVKVALILSFLSNAYHIWLLYQPWYLGGWVGALLR